MALEMKTDLQTFCKKIISLSDQERFTFLQEYYKKVYPQLTPFFTDFHNNKIESAQSFECVSPTRTKSDVNYVPTNKSKKNNDSFSRKTFKSSTSAMTQQTNYNKSERLEECGRIDQNCASSAFIDEVKLNESLTINCNKLTSHTGEYKSVLTSILFDNKESKLRKMLKNRPKPTKSPTKHNTVLETLLFE